MLDWIIGLSGCVYKMKYFTLSNNYQCLGLLEAEVPKPMVYVTNELNEVWLWFIVIYPYKGFSTAGSLPRKGLCKFWAGRGK